jgi:hypothetical protein
VVAASSPLTVQSRRGSALLASRPLAGLPHARRQVGSSFGADAMLTDHEPRRTAPLSVRKEYADCRRRLQPIGESCEV